MDQENRRVKVEVFTNDPLLYGICPDCNNLLRMSRIDLQSSQLDEYPEFIKEENAKIAELLDKLFLKFGDRIMIRLYSMFTLGGFAKSIRRRVWRAPAFIVDRKKITGIPEEKQLLAIVETAIANQNPI